MIRNKKKQNEIIELIPYGLKATCIALSILNRMIKNHKNRKYADEYSECGKLICDIDANNPTARECNIIDYFLDMKCWNLHIRILLKYLKIFRYISSYGLMYINL